MPRYPGPGEEKRKQSLYFPENILREIEREARRLDRSLSWVVQRAWTNGPQWVKALPDVNGVDP